MARIEKTVATHLAAYFKPTDERGRRYAIFAGGKEELLRHAPEGYSLATVRRAPHFAREYLPEGNAPKRVGYIRYLLSTDGKTTTAYTADYWPKREISGAKGLGYYLEAMCTRHIANTCSVDAIDTDSWFSNRARIGQLRKVGLGNCEPYSPREWLKGMGRGIKLRKRG